MLKLDPNVNIASDYLTECFTDLEQVVDKTVEKLKPHRDRFEGIAVRGTSGLLVGPMVASLLSKPWCVVRKPHSDHRLVEGWFGFKTYIIVDDLIATGSTLKRIQQAMNGSAESRGESVECVGYCLYAFDELVWRNGDLHDYRKNYFILPENPKRAALSRQIAAATRPRPVFASANP